MSESFRFFFFLLKKLEQILFQALLDDEYVLNQVVIDNRLDDSPLVGARLKRVRLDDRADDQPRREHPSLAGSDHRISEPHVRRSADIVHFTEIGVPGITTQQPREPALLKLYAD